MINWLFCDRTPLCPKCGAPMVLSRTLPALGGLPELQSFECRPCREAVTRPVEEARPVLHSQTWYFAGE